MSLNLNDKKAVVAEVSAQVAEAQTIVVAEYRGIQVGHLTQLRANARAQGVYLRVLKNTLAHRAVEGTPFASLASDMTGPLIYSISKDAVAAAKVINDFAPCARCVTNGMIIYSTNGHPEFSTSSAVSMTYYDAALGRIYSTTFPSP